jgi:hypothetical protein
MNESQYVKLAIQNQIKCDEHLYLILPSHDINSMPLWPYATVLFVRLFTVLSGYANNRSKRSAHRFALATR